MRRATAIFLPWALGLSATAQAERVARPCRIAPTDGATIPANASTFVGNDTLFRLESDLPLEPLDSNPHGSLFAAGPLAVGEEITLRSRACASHDQATITSMFRVGPPSERPTSIGQLTLGTPVRGNQGGFETPMQLQFSAELIPWLPLTRVSVIEEHGWYWVSRRDTGWGLLRNEPTLDLGPVATSCSAPLKVIAEVAGQPSLELEAACRGCGAAPGGALTAALAAWLLGRRRRANL
ncbi:MAG: hypothetical protein SFW67_07865 [Myxococcaceae bacterium]|nr:hypothetical protein [Myxococcaceae bacterium]